MKGNPISGWHSVGFDKTVLPRILLFFVTLLCCLRAKADPLDTWHVRGPGPTTNQLNAIAWGGSGFVAAGNAGTLAASPDGYKWELLNAGIQTNLQGVAWGGGVYAVVGDAGVVFTSSDVVNWTARASGTTANLSAIAYGTNAFVAVGADHTVLTSTNLGQTWRLTPELLVGALNTVIYEEDMFIAAGENGAILTSPDGLDWTVRHTGGDLNLHLLVHENGSFTAYPWTTNVLFSTNGLDWVPGIDTWGRHLRAVASGGRGLYTFAGVSLDASIAAYFAYSDYVWQAQGKATRAFLRAVAFGNGIFGAVGDSGTIEIGDSGGWWSEIWCGAWPWSGEDLTTVMSPADPSWWPTVRFWASTPGVGMYYYHTNGNWARIQSSVSYWGIAGGMAASPKLVVVVDSKGMVTTSRDNVGWDRIDPGSGQPLRGVAYGRDRFVAVGDMGTVITSANGTNWTKLESGTLSNLWAIAFLSDRFVAVGDHTVITSPDGLSWEAHGAEANLRGVTFKHGLYAAVGLEGKVLTSPDTLTWTPQDSGTTNDLYSIAGDAHQFVAVGDHGILLTARDGTNWTARISPRKQALRGVAFGDGTFVAVGDGWTVIESDPIPQGPYLGPLTFVEGGQLQVSIEDLHPGQVEIQISPDLTAWSTWTNVTTLDSRILVIDPAFTQTGHRFYRALVK